MSDPLNFDRFYNSKANIKVTPADKDSQGIVFNVSKEAGFTVLSPDLSGLGLAAKGGVKKRVNLQKFDTGTGAKIDALFVLNMQKILSDILNTQGLNPLSLQPQPAKTSAKPFRRAAGEHGGTDPVARYGLPVLAGGTALVDELPLGPAQAEILDGGAIMARRPTEPTPYDADVARGNRIVDAEFSDVDEEAPQPRPAPKPTPSPDHGDDLNNEERQGSKKWMGWVALAAGLAVLAVMGGSKLGNFAKPDKEADMAATIPPAAANNASEATQTLSAPQDMDIETSDRLTELPPELNEEIRNLKFDNPQVTSGNRPGTYAVTWDVSGSSDLISSVSIAGISWRNVQDATMRVNGVEQKVQMLYSPEVVVTDANDQPYKPVKMCFTPAITQTILNASTSQPDGGIPEQMFRNESKMEGRVGVGCFGTVKKNNCASAYFLIIQSVE